jgi:hypothetical protein
MAARMGRGSGIKLVIQRGIGETQPMSMENLAAVISFNSDPNDITRTAFFESGEGELLRTFRYSVEVRAALH